MSSGGSYAATPLEIARLLPKLEDPDPDIRYMTLNDLNKVLENGQSGFLTSDFNVCTRIVDGIRGTLLDTNGDVQNMAVKALGAFIPKAPESILGGTIEKISFIQNADTLDSTLAALALRAIVLALAHPVQGVPRSQRVNESYSAISKSLVPRLIGRTVVGSGSKGRTYDGMLLQDMVSGRDTNSLDVLADVAKYFGLMLHQSEVDAMERACVQVLQSEKCGSVMKKKAVAALSTLAPYFDDTLLSKHVSNTIEYLRQSHLTPAQRRLYLTSLGSLARSIPQKFGPYLASLAPFVLAPLSQAELDDQRADEVESDGERDTQIEDVREAALSAIESFLQVCAQDMRAYTKDVIESATRFLKYEPNMADDEDDDQDMDEVISLEDEDFGVEEDFEEETGFEDEDDVSWKVRRGSAKTFSALINTLDPQDPLLYSQIAPALVSRFAEKEESVRNEVITTLSQVIKKSGPFMARQATGSSQASAPTSRKRRRGFSDSLGSDLRTQQDSIRGLLPTRAVKGKPTTKGLTQLTPEIVNGSVKLLKSSTISTKQAAISMLRDLVIADADGFSQSSGAVIEQVVEAMKTASSANVSNVAGNALRTESLRLIRAIADVQTSTILQPYLGKIVPELIRASNERFTKVTLEALATVQSFVSILTSPASATQKESASYLSTLYESLVSRITSADTDTEVRQKAVSVLGLLLGQASGGKASAVFSQKDRFAGQHIIADRLKNELTRLSAVKAVDSIAVLAQQSDDFAPGWLETVSLELGAQLRKSSRALRTASINALKMISLNPASRDSLTDASLSQIVELLLPLLKTDDLQMLTPTLLMLSSLALHRPKVVDSASLDEAICSIATTALSGAALDAAITYVEALGQGGGGQSLMKMLLHVGVSGDTDVTGQVIGTLLVARSGNIGVTLKDFIRELQTTDDDVRKCLALSVLGEVGLRLGAKSELTTQNFTPYFDASSEKVRLASAISLGRAGAGNVPSYLPQIIAALSSGKQYLLLHTIKEILQHNQAEGDIKPYTQDLWQNIAEVGQSEDNKVVAAECLGRLAIIDPTTYLPQLQSFLQHKNPTIRGMVISALRFVFADTDASYDTHLRSTILPLLSTMLQDPDLDNQRLALSTLYSAFQSKADLIMPFLPNVLPTLLQATFIRPELVREVQMGPFKHKVDDGLEIRKQAYETLYALLESPASRLQFDLVAFYDRVVAGITDEHEIKILCCLVLSKLLVITPAESARRLETLAAHFRAVLSTQLKENAVKQDVEKQAEQNKAVIKTSIAFNKALSVQESQTWKEYFEWVKKDLQPLYKIAEDELKEIRDR